MLVVFEQLIIFSCVWTTFLLNHVWMTMLVVFEQLFVFSCVWTAFLLSDDVSCVWTTFDLVDFGSCVLTTLMAMTSLAVYEQLLIWNFNDGDPWDVCQG